jgi:hypothetical protein
MTIGDQQIPLRDISIKLFGTGGLLAKCPSSSSKSSSATAPCVEIDVNMDSNELLKIFEDYLEDGDSSSVSIEEICWLALFIKEPTTWSPDLRCYESI